MKALGVVLMLVGAALALLVLLAFDTTVGDYRGTYNLGLLQMQELLFIGGCALFVGGSTLAAGGEIAERVGPRRRRSNSSALGVEMATDEERADSATFAIVTIGLTVLGAIVFVTWSYLKP